MDLQTEFETIKASAESMAGDIYAIPRRAAILLAIYEDSGKNHNFSLMAAHGALWAYGYFETGGALGRLIAKRYFYNRKEKAFRIGILNEFADSFRRVNRQVCIDTYTNYQFVKQFGGRSEAADLLPPSLYDALCRVHAARRDGRELTPDERRAVFEESFRCEQEITVAPGVQQAVADFECPVMKFLCLHPVVRFSFFPRFRYMMFRDFSRTQERIAKGFLAYEIGQKRGWNRVQTGLHRYGHAPLELSGTPEARFSELAAGNL